MRYQLYTNMISRYTNDFSNFCVIYSYGFRWNCTQDTNYPQAVRECSDRRNYLDRCISAYYYSAKHTFGVYSAGFSIMGGNSIVLCKKKKRKKELGRSSRWIHCTDLLESPLLIFKDQSENFSKTKNKSVYKRTCSCKGTSLLGAMA